MLPEDTFLCHQARTLAIKLEQTDQAAAALVTDLIGRIENKVAMAVPEDTVLIEKDVFRVMTETALLFNFWVDNVGRLSLGVHGNPQNPVFRFTLNPPGRRQQFLRHEVIQALMDVREQLKTPQYG